MQIAVLGRILLGLLILVAVLGIIGLILTLRAKKKGENVEPKAATENVADLNDRFNRARYMSEDGK